VGAQGWLRQWSCKKGRANEKKFPTTSKKGCRKDKGKKVGYIGFAGHWDGLSGGGRENGDPSRKKETGKSQRNGWKEGFGGWLDRAGGNPRGKPKLTKRGLAAQATDVGIGGPWPTFVQKNVFDHWETNKDGPCPENNGGQKWLREGTRNWGTEPIGGCCLKAFTINEVSKRGGSRSETQRGVLGTKGRKQTQRNCRGTGGGDFKVS